MKTSDDKHSITKVADTLGLSASDINPYGHDIAKLPLALLDRPRRSAKPSRLILVSAMTPTPAGAGKTTTAIGLADALMLRGESACLALREPSLGPTLGKKGGATGGGRARLTPMARINLHFTGDFHAVTSAHNLVAAVIDNHLHFGNELELDPNRINWPRVLDIDDRALRRVVTGLGGSLNGPTRETGFEITAASEIMATLCLSENIEDLRQRLARTVIGFTVAGSPVTIADLKLTGALLALLADALQPNLVQTQAGVPALVHGGPFANIAHGCNSVVATKMALALSDWAVTEAGFGFDLGAEKFFDIKARSAGLDTAAVVLVATIPALKMHGGVGLDALHTPDAAAVERGLPNLAKHIENIQCFGERPVVALNRFPSDSDEEIAPVRRYCEEKGVPFAVSSHFTDGGNGALALADAVMVHAETNTVPFRPLYALDQSITEKIKAVAAHMYGANGVVYSRQAEKDLALIEKLGYTNLPVCIAKIPGSLSDDPTLLGRPENFQLHVRGLQLNAGAGFLVVLSGEVLRMPGMPRSPAAEKLDLQDGEITGMDH